tara:strand:+ start:1189 stop:1533 length:345 start_codon:yes stop_codon:yes gene_type:complete
MSDTIKNIEEKNGVVVISTNGYFNNIAGDAVLEVFNQKMESGNTKFLIDMADSKVVNSIGVSILIEIIEKLQAVDGKMAFTNLAGIVEKTFNIMGITKYCDVYESIEVGIEKLS